MNIDEAKNYARAWLGSWVVAANRPSTKAELDLIKSNFDEDDVDAFLEAILHYRNVKCNLSAEFETEAEAQEHAVKAIRAGATYIVIFSPENFEWCLTDAAPNGSLILIGEHIKWLGKGA